MAKYRFSRAVVMLLLLMLLAGVIGHFATDAVCVFLDVIGDGNCVFDGRTTGTNILSAASPVIPELHSGLDIPAVMTVGPMIALAFALFIAGFTVPTHFFSPPPPPPKRHP